MLAFVLLIQTPKIDPAAMALLKKNRDAMLALRGYRAECRTALKKFGGDRDPKIRTYEFATLVAAKPNLMRYDAWRSVGTPLDARPATASTTAFVSNGKRQWMQFGPRYRVQENASPVVLHTILEPWQGFYHPSDSIYEGIRAEEREKAKVAVRRAGREKVDGVVCDRIDIDIESEYQGETTQTHRTVFLRPDGLVRRQVRTYVSGDSGFTATADLTRIEKDPDLRAQRYVYTPPKEVVAEADEKPVPLLASGTPAPDFVAKDRDGKAIRLSDLRGRVVVLDFWASWCGPCLASMPHTQSVAERMRKEGLPVTVLALDDGEPEAAFKAWTGRMGLKYPALTFAHSPQASDVSGKLYRVTGIPTQYVIDAKGTIRASFVGYGGPNDDLEKAVRAALEG